MVRVLPNIRPMGDVFSVYAATGHLLIRSDGLISDGELTLAATDGDETAEANVRFSALGTTRVGSEPPWVSREFSKA